MTEQEAIKIIKRLKAYYPYLYKSITKDDAKEIVEVYQTQFKDIDSELVLMTIDNWAGKRTAAPSIAEIKYSIGDLYNKFNNRYSELLKDENADSKEVEKISRWRDIAWSCMTQVIK